MVVSIILTGFIIWFAYRRFTRFDIAAKRLDERFRAMELSPDAEFKPVPPGFPFHKDYARWQAEAEKMGFSKLGDMYSETDEGGVISGSATRVMVDASGNTIFAFKRIISGLQTIIQMEMENWSEEGVFFYTSNNRFVYHLKSPELIKVNKTQATGIGEFAEAHRAFLENYSSPGFRKYDSLETVVQTTVRQAAMRDELAKTKEFPLDEEEACLLNNHVNDAETRKIYSRLREIRKARGESGK